MDTVLTVGHPTTIRSHAILSPERAARRIGLALLAWSRRVEAHRPTQAELAVLHERRLEADRLRTEHYRSLAVTRLL